MLQGIADTTYKLLTGVDNPPAFLERVCYILRQYLMLSTGSLRMADEYFDRWFMAKPWRKSFTTKDILKIYNLHLDAMLKASTYAMNPEELLVRTAIESLLTILACDPAPVKDQA